MQTQRSNLQSTLARLLGLLILTIPTASCQTMMGSAAPTDKVFCTVAQPIYWSAKDTAQTVGQIKEHNAVGRALCGWGKKSGA